MTVGEGLDADANDLVGDLRRAVYTTFHHGTASTSGASHSLDDDRHGGQPSLHRLGDQTGS